MKKVLLIVSIIAMMTPAIYECLIKLHVVIAHDTLQQREHAYIWIAGAGLIGIAVSIALAIVDTCKIPARSNAVC